MADLKISAATPIVSAFLDASDMLPLAKAGETVAYHVTVQQLLNYGYGIALAGEVGTGNSGSTMHWEGGAGDGIGAGGGFQGTAGQGGDTGPGGDAALYGGNGGNTSGNGGNISLYGGSASGGGSGDGGFVQLVGGTGSGAAGQGGDVHMYPGNGAGTGRKGRVHVANNASLWHATFAWNPGEAMNGRTIYTAERPVLITAIRGRVDAANGVASTLTVNKTASGTAHSAGTATHTGTMNLAGTANTNQTLALSATPANLLLAAGDSLGIVTTGVLGTSSGCITVHLTPQ